MTSTNIGLTKTQAERLAEIFRALPGISSVSANRDSQGELGWDVHYSVAKPGTVAWHAWERSQQQASPADPSVHLLGVSPLC